MQQASLDLFETWEAWTEDQSRDEAKRFLVPLSLLAEESFDQIFRLARLALGVPADSEGTSISRSVS